MCSLSWQEVAAQRLTWRHCLCSGRGCSDDDNDVETTTTTTSVTVSLRSNQQCKANTVNVNDNVDISVLRQLHWDVTATTVGVLSLRWWSDGATRALVEGATRAVVARRGSRQQWWRWADNITRAGDKQPKAR